jgi:hypothetical protein
MAAVSVKHFLLEAPISWFDAMTRATKRIMDASSDNQAPSQAGLPVPPSRKGTKTRGKSTADKAAEEAKALRVSIRGSPG